MQNKQQKGRLKGDDMLIMKSSEEKKRKEKHSFSLIMMFSSSFFIFSFAFFQFTRDEASMLSNTSRRKRRKWKNFVSFRLTNLRFLFVFIFCYEPGWVAWVALRLYPFKFTSFASHLSISLWHQ